MAYRASPSLNYKVFSGGESSIFSPYSTRSASTIQAYSSPATVMKFRGMDATSGFLHPTSLPYRGGGGEGERLAMRDESPTLGNATSYRAWSTGPVSPTKTPVLMRAGGEPVFCEEAHSADRIMPPESSPLQRFSNARVGTSPSMSRVKLVSQRGPADPTPGGFCKANNGCAAKGLISPVGTPGAGPALTHAMQKRMAEDSSLRLALARDHYDSRFVTANVFFRNDSTSLKSSPAGRFQPLTHPGPLPVTGFAMEATKPVWRAEHDEPLPPLARRGPSVGKFLPPTGPEGAGRVVTGFTRPNAPSLVKDPAGESSLPSPSLSSRLVWKQKMTDSGFGPFGVDVIKASDASMYQSINKVEMGSPTRRTAVGGETLLSPTRSSGYRRDVEPCAFR